MLIHLFIQQVFAGNSETLIVQRITVHLCQLGVTYYPHTVNSATITL